MAKGKSKKKGPKYLGSLAAVVVGLLVLVGLAALQEAGYLEATVGRRGSEGKDYQTVELPPVQLASTEVTGCATPTPTFSPPGSSLSPTSDGQVKGITTVGGCARGGDGWLEREYTGFFYPGKNKNTC